MYIHLLFRLYLGFVNFIKINKTINKINNNHKDYRIIFYFRN